MNRRGKQAEAQAGGVLIVGAGSAIARAMAARFAASGCDIILAGRDLEDLAATVADLQVRYGVRAAALAFEALDFDAHAGFFVACATRFEGGLAGVIICHGTLPDQAHAQADWKTAQQTIDVNFTSAVSILNLAAEYLEPRKAGFICAISSVAGDRGRQSNYLYGAAKGGLTIYLQGLRQRMAKSGISVVTVKPGFIDTAMTWSLAGMFLVATPRRVAEDTLRAAQRGRGTIYSPWFWRIIMTIIKSIPERVFNRIKL